MKICPVKFYEFLRALQIKSSADMRLLEFKPYGEKAIEVRTVLPDGGIPEYGSWEVASSVALELIENNPDAAAMLIEGDWRAAIKCAKKAAQFPTRPAGAH